MARRKGIDPMRVMVTGHRGKIGSAVHKVIEEVGHEVTGFDLADGDDMLDANSVDLAMKGCDAVAHLAMTMGNIPDEHSFASGVMGTWNILQAAERNGLQRVVSYSSVNAMGIFMGEATPDFFPIDESHPCRPGRAYGMSKLLAEQTCALFTMRTSIPTVCIRPPAVLTKTEIERYRSRLRDDPDYLPGGHWEYGCFILVDELARATLSALICPDPGHAVLLVNAPDIATAGKPSRELAKKLLPDVEWRGSSEFDTEPYRPLMDTSRAREVLGWQPQYRWGKE